MQRINRIYRQSDLHLLIVTMEQVAANHGFGIRDIIRAPCVDDVQNFEPPKNFEDFHNFPKAHGFPIKPDFTIDVETKPAQNLSAFIQAWLFFGLIFTVIQENERPVLNFEQLLDGEDIKNQNRTRNLSTKYLHRAIGEWTNWEVSKQDGVRIRMIKIGWVLDLARQVIQKNFAYDMRSNEAGVGKLGQVGEQSRLILMCLGETLSAAKARIVEMCKVDTSGWHGDDNVGWGPPKHIFDKMDEDGWCPRAIAILRGQVNSNATMLVAAYQAYRGSHRITRDHKNIGCTPEKCKMKSMDENGNYTSYHTKTCQNREECKPCGPPLNEIINILGNDNENLIPLLEFDDKKKGGERFKVVRFDRNNSNEVTEFVTISHVWSDGWGNEEENKLNECQLKFINRQIKRVIKSGPALFWMDTLVAPVTKSYEKQRKKAIRQIPSVFGKSSSTIVLDNGLCGTNAGQTDQPAVPAMALYSSVWMRRLWTLQEAYLSNRIYITFEEAENGASNLLLLADFENHLKEVAQQTKSGITQVISDQLSHMVMGAKKRPTGRFGTNRVPGIINANKNDPAIVADVYRAARWRTTGKAEHEILALATLLELDIENTAIENAGLAAPGTANKSPNTDQLEELACVFWSRLHYQRNGIIPSGMIFLPGEKVNRAGFGWAPKSWFSTDEMNYPDPLNCSAIESTEFNKANGLRVSYPGFLLYPNSPGCRARILSTSMDAEPFRFPVDRSLNEWYSFQRLYDTANDRHDQLTRLEKERTQLAIILSGSLPKEFPKEVALLVELPNTTDAKTDRNIREYHASIIHRVLIRKEPNPFKNDNDWLQWKTDYVSHKTDKPVCFGEALGPSQRWWVDRPVNLKTENAQETTISNSGSQLEPLWNARKKILGFFGFNNDS
ncbi:hypothetical protein HD806DRAFT_511259 [Xylariaceae sp. AK1471]|nr:hypothetical protein HD806DRAFT_511259 [Xylariaceae sp. AK1471]